jgi:uncharacterized protein
MTDSSSLTLWQPRLLALATAGLGDDGAHDINHLHRVWRNAALLLQEHAEADALTVMAACYLHDLVNLPKNHPERHLASRQAAALACRQLAELDFPEDKLAGVAHAIETHSFSADLIPTTIEAQIVQDADRIDALGAVGLARLFYTAARMDSALAHGTTRWPPTATSTTRRTPSTISTPSSTSCPARCRRGRAAPWPNSGWPLTDFRAALPGNGVGLAWVAIASTAHAVYNIRPAIAPRRAASWPPDAANN